MNKHVLLLALSLGFISDNLSAGAMGPILQGLDWRWVGTLSAGPVWEQGGRTQTFYLAPNIEKSYVSNQTIHTLFDGEVFAGVQKKLSKNIQGQFGLAVVATSNANLSGAIWDDASPEFSNYTYAYKIQHTHIAAKSKLLAEAGYWLTPWVSGSVALGFNTAYAFENTPTLYEAIANPNFTSQTQTTISFTAGAGVQKNINDHWQVGAGYEFVDWGVSQFGRASGQTQNAGLRLDHLYTNGILFNLTYLT